MRDPNSPSLHGWGQPQDVGGFPGVSQPGFGGDPFYSGPPAFVNPTVLPPQGLGGSAPAKGNFSLNDVKGFIDRMGGIDGVINGITKFQKFMSTMQQMAPLFRVLLNKGSAATKAATDDIVSGGVKTRPRRKSGKRGPRSRQRRK